MHIQQKLITNVYLSALNKMPGASNKFLTGIFYVWVLMMFSHYTSVLNSFLVYKNYETLFSFLEDIVHVGKDYRVLLLRGAVMHNYFMVRKNHTTCICSKICHQQKCKNRPKSNWLATFFLLLCISQTSDLEAHKQLLQLVKKNPQNLIKDYSELEDILCYEKAVFLEMSYRVDITLSNTALCNLVNKPQIHFRQWQLTAFRKDLPYENIFKSR